MTVISELFGGLALFLYGMSVMSHSLKALAGGRLESVLATVTKSRLRGFALGLGVTSLIQSSSAVMVMLVGLVDSGILEFSRTFGVIMGSNVGTTVTAWLISLNDVGGILTFLKPIVFAPILALLGVILTMASKRQRTRDVGTIAVGFAILIIGMDMMSEAVSFVKDSEAFSGLLTMFSNPLAAVLVATLFTAVIQSSSASVGIVQALALTGDITLGMAVPLVLGANIGTCVTGLIAAIGTSTGARRVAWLQTYFNVFGTAVFLILTVILKLAAPELTSQSVGVAGIAAVHTLFNVLTSVIFIPLFRPVIRITEKTVR